MTAFVKWFQQNYSANEKAGANHLFRLCLMGAPDSQAWDWVKKAETESGIDATTFLEAARLILKETDSNDRSETKTDA